MDVRPLYTNIPNNEGIKAVETTLKRKKSSKKINHQFSEININTEQFYVQLHKLFTNKRMCNGNKMRPNTRKHLQETHIYPLIKQKVQLYLRYIDDILFIWTGSENELQQFISKINELHPPIRFDFNYSKTQILFLDITVTKLSTVKLLTTLYKKEIDQQSYLHRKSEHSETLKQSIPYSHTQILKRIFTTEENFTENLKGSQSG